VRYWAEQRLERVEFVARILRGLDQRNWPNRSDIGWSEFDVEVYGNRWSAVQLVTAAEDHPRGRQLVRCRLRARWSLHAKVVFWLLVALEAIVVGFFGRWSALLLLTLPAFAYYQHRQMRTLQSLLIVFLDGLAKELKLIKVPPSQPATSTPVPAAAATSTPPAPESKPIPIRVNLPQLPPKESPAPEKEVPTG
jgi:hypothetical protein